MTERERERGGTIDDLKAEYPGAPTVSGPTREDPEVHGNMRVEPTNERPTGGSAKSFDAPESGGGQQVVIIAALVGLAVILVIALVWALSGLIPFGV